MIGRSFVFNLQLIDVCNFRKVKFIVNSRELPWGSGFLAAFHTSAERLERHEIGSRERGYRVRRSGYETQSFSIRLAA
jgi:hypothetical protein